MFTTAYANQPSKQANQAGAPCWNVRKHALPAHVYDDRVSTAVASILVSILISILQDRTRSAVRAVQATTLAKAPKSGPGRPHTFFHPENSTVKEHATLHMVSYFHGPDRVSYDRALSCCYVKRNVHASEGCKNVTEQDHTVRFEGQPRLKRYLNLDTTPAVIAVALGFGDCWKDRS